MVSYEIKPLDTLFFRGSTPMESGMVNAISMFPPPLSVIKGALTTAYLKQHDKLSASAEEKQNILDSVNVKGVLIKKAENLYVPAPATWYVEKMSAGEDTVDFRHYCGMKVVKAVPISSITGKDNPLGIQCSEGDIPFVKETQKNCEAKALSGCWVKKDLVTSENITIKKDDILLPGDIYSLEDRTGVGLDANKHTVEGMLYSATHLRLKDDISIIVCLENDLDLPDSIIQLGGEKRLSTFKKLNEEIEMPQEKANFISYVPIEANTENVEKLIASGKFQITAGWDLNKKFHKDSKTWIPAGAVFAEEIK